MAKGATGREFTDRGRDVAQRRSPIAGVGRSVPVAVVARPAAAEPAGSGLALPAGQPTQHSVTPR